MREREYIYDTIVWLREYFVLSNSVAAIRLNGPAGINDTMLL